MTRESRQVAAAHDDGDRRRISHGYDVPSKRPPRIPCITAFETRSAIIARVCGSSVPSIPDILIVICEPAEFGVSIPIGVRLSTFRVSVGMIGQGLNIADCVPVRLSFR